VVAIDQDAVCPMPHGRLPAAELPPELAARATASGLTTFFAQFGHAPGLIESWLAWYQPLMTGGILPTRIKELCRLTIARRTGCHMCRFGRFPDPSGSGPAASDEEADAVLADDFSAFGPVEQAALAYTVAYWDDHRSVPDEVIEAACDALGKGGFIELAVLVAQFTGMGRLFSMLGVPNEALGG